MNMNIHQSHFRGVWYISVSVCLCAYECEDMNYQRCKSCKNDNWSSDLGTYLPQVTWKITSWWLRIWEDCVCWCPNTSSLRIILIVISTCHFPDTLQTSNKLLQSSQPFKIGLFVIHRRYWGALLRFPLYGRSTIPQILGILATEGPSRVPYWELLSTMKNSLTQEYTPPRAQPSHGLWLADEKMQRPRPCASIWTTLQATLAPELP